MKKTGGLRRRWLINTLGLICALGLVCVMAVTVYFAARYYSELEWDLNSRGENTKEIFSDHDGQSYDEYYKSCVSFAQNFGDDERLQLQFVAAAGDIVASSRGQWTGEVPDTSEIENAISTRGLSYFVGRDPAMNERIMALSVPVIYSNGEVIGVLRYVSPTKFVDMQILTVALTGFAVLIAVVAAVLLCSRHFIRSVMHPVAEITEKAKLISSGSYGVQLQTRYQDEIGDLAETINEMSSKIS